MNDDFFGLFYSGLVSKGALRRLIAGAPADKVIEICIHPGFPAPKGQPFYSRQSYNDFISAPARQIEHDILLDADLAGLLERRGLVLRGYDGRAKGL